MQSTCSTHSTVNSAQPSLENWQNVLLSADLHTVEGLSRYLVAWAQQDIYVQKWMSGSEVCQHPTADLGGWLADYVNTQFLVTSNQAPPGVIYKVIDNLQYHSLNQLIMPKQLGPSKTGNIWEQLCWHAFEQDRGVFVLAVIWNTSNRRLLLAPTSCSSDSHPAVSLPPPPPPPEFPTLQSSSSDAHPAAFLQPPPPPPAHTPPPSPTLQGSPGVDLHPTKLTQAGASHVRARQPISGLHSAMRQLLQDVSAASEQKPYQRKIEVPPTLPWQEDLAFHPKSELLIGPGVEHFFLYFMPEIDPNRKGQIRLNFVIERQDGSHVLLHPGGRPSQDAQPIYLAPGKFSMAITSC